MFLLLLLLLLHLPSLHSFLSLSYFATNASIFVTVVNIVVLVIGVLSAAFVRINEKIQQFSWITGGSGQGSCYWFNIALNEVVIMARIEYL